MAVLPIKQQLFDQIDRLDPEQIQRVLDFAAHLADPDATLPPGAPGSVLARFIGSIPLDDVVRMEEAIKECDRIDPDEW